MSDDLVRRVRMRTAMAGDPTLAVGEVVTLPSAVALAWVSEGMADLVDEVRREPAEAAMSAGAPERAMRPRTRRRG